MAGGQWKKIIKYYPEHKRVVCVHAQERHALIAAMCVFSTFKTTEKGHRLLELYDRIGHFMQEQQTSMQV
jgi:hypothetical protein